MTDVPPTVPDDAPIPCHRTTGRWQSADVSINTLSNMHGNACFNRNEGRPDEHHISELIGTSTLLL